MQELCLGGSLRDKVLKQMTMWNKARPSIGCRSAPSLNKGNPCDTGPLCHGSGSVELFLRLRPEDELSWLQALYTYAEGLRWATQIAEGLAYLHGLNPTIIHRDLKLDNVPHER